MNNRYVIRVAHPLIRPGLTIETEASEKYVVDVVNTLFEKVRELNAPDASVSKPMGVSREGALLFGTNTGTSQ